MCPCLYLCCDIFAPVYTSVVIYLPLFIPLLWYICPCLYLCCDIFAPVYNSVVIHLPLFIPGGVVIYLSLFIPLLWYICPCLYLCCDIFVLVYTSVVIYLSLFIPLLWYICPCLYLCCDIFVPVYTSVVMVPSPSLSKSKKASLQGDHSERKWNCTKIYLFFQLQMRQFLFQSKKIIKEATMDSFKDWRSSLVFVI
jgi:hypothetical protein